MDTASNKLKAVVHFIIANCDPNKLGAIKLNKILWFSDRYAYRKNGHSITGSDYVRREHGPVSESIYDVLDELKNENKISISGPEQPFQPRLYKSLEDAECESLSKSDKEVILGASNCICDDFTASRISDRTHDEIWGAADEGEHIPLEATLVAHPGDYRHEVMAWAREVLAKRRGVLS